MLYLWFCPDLVHPSVQSFPLGIWNPDTSTWTWACGQPPAVGHPFMAEVIETVPDLLARGVRFNQTGMGRGNVFEGEPFLVSEPAPPCPTCGQTGDTPGGEYPCVGCGRPQVHDYPDPLHWLALAAGAEAETWTWERHGDGWALYVGRTPTAHGRNVLWVPDGRDAWDASQIAVRTFIAAALNAVVLNNRRTK